MLIAGNQLATFNQETEVLVEQRRTFHNMQKDEHELQELCESFIKGQGTIYVLENHNKEKTPNGIMDNGPEYMEHAWNTRPLNKSAVANLIQIGAGGHRIYPKFQEHAIIIAASSLLVNDITLAKYQSHDFPPIVLNGEAAGNIYIINGHHRIAAWRQIHQALLTQLQSYEKMLKDFGKSSNCDPFAVKEAHDHVEKLQQQLYAEGGWGAIVLDYGMF